MLREIEMVSPFVKLDLSPKCHGAYGYQSEEEFTRFVSWHRVCCEGDPLEGILR